MNSRNSTNPRNSTGSVVVLITAGSEQEAHKIAELLVNAKKAACVNILPRVGSLFRWKGKIESAHESLLLVKTKASLLPEIIDLVKQVHSYEVRKSSPYLSSMVAENTASGWTMPAIRDVSGQEMVPTGTSPAPDSAKS